MPDESAVANPIDSVETHLQKVAQHIRRSMLDALPEGEPKDAFYALMREYPSRPEKGIRPALCISAGRAFGAASEDLYGIAVVIELLHDAFLVHDDIADESEFRRGRLTLSAAHGTGLAINAGDGMAVVAGQLLRRATERLDRNVADLVWSEFDAMAMRSLEGQAMEIAWRSQSIDTLQPDDYLALILRKTCWYTTIHPLRVGAIIGSKGTADLADLVRFGFHFGAAFQIRDDLLNLVGNEAVYGKEILGDLYEGKRTLPLVHLASCARGKDAKLVRNYPQRELIRTRRRSCNSSSSTDGHIRQHRIHASIRRGDPGSCRGLLRTGIHHCRAGGRS
jgi:geranylgeranyl diphosphate synthase type II